MRRLSLSHQAGLNSLPAPTTTATEAATKAPAIAVEEPPLEVCERSCGPRPPGGATGPLEQEASGRRSGSGGGANELVAGSCETTVNTNRETDSSNNKCAHHHKHRHNCQVLARRRARRLLQLKPMQAGELLIQR